MQRREDSRAAIERLRHDMLELFSQFQRDQLGEETETTPSDPAESARRALRAAADARRAWKAVEPRLPGIIYFARANGALSAAEVARELDVSESYVHRITREITLVSFRVDVLDGPPGPGWQPWSSGQELLPSDMASPAEYGTARLSEAREGRTETFRVFAWEGEFGTVEEAAYSEQSRTS